MFSWAPGLTGGRCPVGRPAERAAAFNPAARTTPTPTPYDDGAVTPSPTGSAAASSAANASGAAT